jgi:hypothetical protein
VKTEIQDDLCLDRLADLVGSKRSVQHVQ